MRKFILAACLSLLTFSSTALAAENTLQCLERDQQLLCRFSMRSFVSQIAHTLGNGWQNTLDFDFFLIDQNMQIVAQSRISATQRCYIDPFESPCLLLWKGAKSWQNYEGEAELFSNLSNLRVQALGLKGIKAGNYFVRVHIQLNAITEKQVSELQNWFKRTGQYRFLPFGKNEASLLGSFLNAFAEFSNAKAEEKLQLQTTYFYINEIEEASPSKEE